MPLENAFRLSGRGLESRPNDMEMPQSSPFESTLRPKVAGRIDELVAARWRQVGVDPANLCSDSTFLRRAYLDVIGTLPTASEARSFFADPSRSKLIDGLLDRDELADYWALKWGDVLRVKSEFPINLWPLAAQAYSRWIHAAIRDRMPYDRFVRTLLTASGGNFREPEVNFHRAVQNKKPQGLAAAVALTFLGVRAEKWPKSRLDAFAQVYSRLGFKATGEWKEEVVFHDPSKGRGAPLKIVFPDDTKATVVPEADPRVALADWLISPKNPWFCKCIVNRVWSWLFGRGIVHEPDDFRSDNPPQNPQLLAYLQEALIAYRYDLRALFRLILNSNTYQLATMPNGDRETSEANFGHYTVRRLEAEVLIDALNQITGMTESYSSAAPEPYTFIPEEQRSIALADGSITSPFLDMFGRPPRDTGLSSERNNRVAPDQRLHLLNSSHILRKIERGPKMVALMRGTKTGRKFVEELYLTVLSRYPTPQELQKVAELSSNKERKPVDTATDLAWALINSSEFLFRH